MRNQEPVFQSTGINALDTVTSATSMLNFTANSELFHSIYRRHAQQENCTSECYMQAQTAANLVDGTTIKKLSSIP